MNEKISHEEEIVSPAENARALYPTLHETLLYAPLIDADIPEDPADSRHLLITREVLQKFAPDLVAKFDEMAKPRTAPPGLEKAQLPPRTPTERQLHDLFNPFRKNKMAGILSPAAAIAAYLEDEEMIIKSHGLMQTFKINFLIRESADVTVNFAREVYEFGKQAEAAYRKREGLE